MNVILVTYYPSLVRFLVEAFKESKIRGEIFWVSSYGEIQNNLANTEDIDAIFLDSRFFASTHFKLVEQFVEVGFGCGKKKTLIVIGNLFYTNSFMEAGCSHATNWTFQNLTALIRRLDKEIHGQLELKFMSRAG